MSVIRRSVECDGGPYCQATEHIEGCYATARPHGLTGDAGEVERLRQQLRGAVAEIEQIAARVPADWAKSEDRAQRRVYEAVSLALTRLGGQ